MTMKFKLTPLEKKWILYDVGNSAFAMLTATILPIYFNYLAKKAGLSSVDYLSYWGYAVSICTLLIAIMGPILGAIADVKDLKKKLFELFLLLGVFGCAMLGFVPSWFFFLIVFVLTNTGYSASLSPNAWIPFLLKDLPGDTSEAASLLRLGSHSFYSLQN